MIKTTLERMDKYKLVLISLLVFVLLMNFLISRHEYKECFRTFDIKTNEELDIVVNAKIEVTRIFPMISNLQRFNIDFQVDGRTYRYFAQKFIGRKEKFIPLSMQNFDYGVILANQDFSKFAVLFDEEHHAIENGVSYYFTHPQMDKKDSFALLNELLIYNNYELRIKENKK